jgi:hypothetical protein
MKQFELRPEVLHERAQGNEHFLSSHGEQFRSTAKAAKQPSFYA